MTDDATPGWDQAIARYLHDVAHQPVEEPETGPTGQIGPASPRPEVHHHPEHDGPAPWPDVEQEPDPLAGIRVALAERHGVPALRRAAASAKAVVASDPGPNVLAHSATEAQRPVTTGRRIAVVGIDGGSGGTTVAAVLTGLLAGWRHDGVAVVAGRPDAGALADRLPACPAVEPASLLADGPPEPARLPLVVTHPASAVDVPVAALVLWLCRSHAVTVIDAGPDPDAAVVHDAHTVVLVTSPSVRGIDRVRELRDDAVAAKAVVAVVDTGRPTGIRVGEAVRHLAPRPHVLGVPVDRHLAGGVGIDLGLLSERTTAALAEVAAAAMTVATTPATRPDAAGAQADDAAGAAR